ncbi:MAG: hypothetical protein AAB421_03335 [Patescibacteria group bacterium]
MSDESDKSFAADYERIVTFTATIVQRVWKEHLHQDIDPQILIGPDKDMTDGKTDVVIDTENSILFMKRPEQPSFQDDYQGKYRNNVSFRFSELGKMSQLWRYISRAQANLQSS